MSAGGKKKPPGITPKPKEPAPPPKPYLITLGEQAKADLRALDVKTRTIVGRHIQQALAFPHQAANVKPIPPGFRLRVGDFRVFYVVDNGDRVVAVTNVVRRGPGTYR